MLASFRFLLLSTITCGLVVAGGMVEGLADDGSPAKKNATCCEKCEQCKDSQSKCATCCAAVKMKIGAVAYAPSAVTIFEGIRKYFKQHDFPIDYVLYSNYDALVAALERGEVDVAWNTPLAHAQYHVAADGKSQALVMRDVEVWRSPEFSHCAFTAPADFDPQLAARFTELMLAMDAADPETAEVMRLEGTQAWVVGSQAGFQELFEAIERAE